MPHRRNRRASMLCRALLLALPLVALLSAPAFARVLIVTKRAVSYSHSNTIQKAVNKARKGDWILIDKGKYPETVKVKTSGLHLRGLDRNKVIVDGRHRKNTNGIEVSKGANGVYIENLTVRNFDRPNSGGHNGNEIWWNGGDRSGKIGMSGWYGQYLTTYDTGLLGGYGIFMSNAVNGSLKHVYASGFNDSGVYLGACRDCHGLIDDATVERSALGYSGTNSGGHIVVKNSTFRNNSVGVSPNSLNNDDQPPPQDGACDSGSNTTPTPTFASTDVQRCTIFDHNTVVNNNNLTAPANPTLLRLPWGIGFELPGTYADLIRNNTIKGNPNFGILGHENPDPYPPTAATIEFQLSGMRFENNVVTGNATRPGGADIGLEGGAFGSGSVNNCFTGNKFATSSPANIEGTWGCQNATTPQGGVDLLLKILGLVDESGARHQKAQKAPGNQKTMPRPCRGVPKNKLCG